MYIRYINSNIAMINIDELKNAIIRIITDGDIDIDLYDLNDTSVMICDIINCMDETLNIIPEEVIMCINKISEDAEDLLTDLIEGDVKLDSDIIVPTAVGLTKIPETIIQKIYDNMNSSQNYE